MGTQKNTDSDRISELENMSHIEELKNLATTSAIDISLNFVNNLQSIILYGPPGTGKTRMSNIIQQRFAAAGKLGLVEQIQFHKDFSYEDFIEGYVPDSKGHYSIREGLLKSFCSKIKKENPDLIHFLLIDEVNRADISAVFGEALYLLEDRSQRKLKTAHSQEDISLPENLVIIGTMNTADRNIAVIDFALRRRFMFIPVFPDYDELQKWLSTKGFSFTDFSVEEYVKAVKTINSRILNSPLMGKNMQLGQSMFVPKNIHEKEISLESITEVFNFVIFPQIESYTGFGYEEELSKILNPSITTYLKAGALIPQDQIIGFIKSLLLDREVTHE